VRVLWAELNKRYTREECEQYDLIASDTTGTDHIDNGNVPLICLKGETEFLRDVHATAEHTIALILSLVRKIPSAHADVCKGNWNREAWQGSELHGKILGVIGYGRVGKQVADISESFGVMPLPYDPYGDISFSVWKTVLKSDIITVHVPLNEETKGMFGAEQFAMMKKGAYFINTSRGGVVDESALLDALNSGHLGGAALDVVDGEPAVNPALLEYARTHDNLILTPHIGGNTIESRKKTQLFIAQKIKEYIEGCDT
jgi:D-3-phosphoglycerate dehydrogenase